MGKYQAGDFAGNWQGDNSEPAPAGWAIDADGWYVRPAKPGDIDIGDEPHFGFVCEGKAFVRSAAFARDYDNGVIPPFVPDWKR